VSRSVERVVVDRMMLLAQTAAMPQVRAEATMVLSDLQEQITDGLDKAEGAEGADRAHLMLIASDIRRYLNRPMETGATPSVLPQPPGSPIGDPGRLWGGGWLSGSLELEGLVQDQGLVCSWY
jgi:hypothetical protein